MKILMSLSDESGPLMVFGDYDGEMGRMRRIRKEMEGKVFISL